MNEREFDALATQGLRGLAARFEPDVETAWSLFLRSDSLDAAGDGSKKRRHRFVALLLAAVLAASAGVALGEKLLTGDDLAKDMGLPPHTWPSSGPIRVVAGQVIADGQVLADCSAPEQAGAKADQDVLVVEVTDGRFYCVVADDPLDAWIIAKKLQGHVPTQEEIEYERKALAGLERP